jgi:SagB-type dehydrogenase family enzyme
MHYPKDYRAFLKADGWQRWGDEKHETDERNRLPRPPVEKPYPRDAQLIDLVAPEDISLGTMPLRDVIARRKSRRKYSDKPLSLEDLSFLLWATQGVREKRQGSSGEWTFRTVPSGGSLHTFETYLFINRVDSVEPGLYRYLPLEHKLLPMPNAVSPEQVTEACMGQSFAGSGAVTFIWTTIPYRMEWRYTVVAHKVIAIDAGHLCQNLYLAAESIGCGTCAIGAYTQNKMDALLGVDGEDELTIYVAPVGRVE